MVIEVYLTLHHQKQNIILFYSSLGPARCSRDTAKVAVFRLASSHPQPETLPRGYPNDCPSLSRAGGAKRAAGRFYQDSKKQSIVDILFAHSLLSE
jgi:hypothetical protein